MVDWTHHARKREISAYEKGVPEKGNMGKGKKEKAKKTLHKSPRRTSSFLGGRGGKEGAGGSKEKLNVTATEGGTQF